MPNFIDSCESRIVWKIENFNCLKGESFFSPPIEGANFVIEISQENSYIFANINNWNFSYNVDYYWSFSFLDSNDMPLICIETIKKTSKRLVRDEFKFPNKTIFFPNDTLRLECRLWRRHSQTVLPVSIFYHTRIEPNVRVIQKTFSCIIPDINPSEYNFSETFCNGQNLGIKVTLPYAGLFSVHLTTELFGFSAKIIVFLLNSTGKRIEFGNHVAKFVSDKRTCQFHINVSKNMLLQHANKFLVSGTRLSLIFTCTFTGHFCYDSIVEESEIFNTCTIGNSATAAVSEAKTNSNETNNVSDEPEVSHTNGPDTISQAFQKMLREGYLSDFTLKVGDKTFPVHKNILGVRSKVFRAMFDSDMKEMQDNCMDIKDIDGDTLQRMLQFVYSDKIDRDMDSTEASSLYAAADFYALENLKQSCSAILKDGLSPPNALGVLALADLHQDQQLKSAALDFISLYDQDIVDTEAWIKFEEENAKLAMETLRKLYARKMRG